MSALSRFQMDIKIEIIQNPRKYPNLFDHDITAEYFRSQFRERLFRLLPIFYETKENLFRNDVTSSKSPMQLFA